MQIRESIRTARNRYMQIVRREREVEMREPTSGVPRLTVCALAILYRRRLIHREDSGMPTDEANIIRIAEMFISNCKKSSLFPSTHISHTKLANG